MMRTNQNTTQFIAAVNTNSAPHVQSVRQRCVAHVSRIDLPVAERNESLGRRHCRRRRRLLTLCLALQPTQLIGRDARVHTDTVVARDGAAGRRERRVAPADAVVLERMRLCGALNGVDQCRGVGFAVARRRGVGGVA